MRTVEFKINVDRWSWTTTCSYPGCVYEAHRSDNVIEEKGETVDSLDGWKRDLERMEDRLDALYPEESMVKAVVKSKLYEARMWAAEIQRKTERKNYGID